MKMIKNPLSINDTHLPVQSVLRILAAQGDCDGEPYDQMMIAADYIDELENQNKELSDSILRINKQVDKMINSIDSGSIVLQRGSND